MSKLRYIRTKKQWSEINRITDESKAKYLRSLSESDGIRIFLDMYTFAQQMKPKKRPRAGDDEKLKVLADIHATFNKVKK